jgi:small acid-soluble spore protein F (minor alpha/beta-type SASP)
MSRKRKSIMSDNLKHQLAQELGYGDAVLQDGYGALSARDCGNMVKLAVQKADQQLSASQISSGY